MANFDYTDHPFSGVLALKFFGLLAKRWSCQHDQWTKSWVKLFPSVTRVIVRMWRGKKTNKTKFAFIYPFEFLTSFHALGSRAIPNPSQSPTLAHCSVHEWVTAGSERWKVYCGADPDTACCLLSVLTVMATVMGSAYAILGTKEVHIFCTSDHWQESQSLFATKKYNDKFLICDSSSGTWDCTGASSARKTTCCSSSCSMS